MFLFSVTIFLSSYLLFLVQPMIARMILPWFGGTAAVWATCMVFFQIVLLLGYLYAHRIVQKMTLPRQRWLHIVLLVASLVFLPLAPNAAFKPIGTEDPMLRILALLATSIGLPYLLLSTTGPLMQAWFVQARPGAIPYRLFALSNFGSMLALLSYPPLIEPRLGLRQQSLFWSAGFGLFVAFCILTSLWSLRRSREAAATIAEPEAPVPVPGWGMRIDWILFAMCPSILLLALTTHMTQDVAAIPFLWVIPLSLYLLSFILCFDTDRWYRRWLFIPLAWISLFVIVMTALTPGNVISITRVVAAISIAFFLVCMACHGELSRRKPHPQHLTLFFLMISIGGALGGLFVGLLAPVIFRANYELPIGLALAVYLLITAVTDVVEAKQRWRWLKPISAALGLVFFGLLGYRLNALHKGAVFAGRNFYGELRVQQSGSEGDWMGRRILMNGTIDHGEQFLHPRRAGEIGTYYCPSSGIGLMMDSRSAAPQKVGVVGLGTGTLAGYSRKGDLFRFYDINPMVVHVAKTYFTYLPKAEGTIEIVMGDARLSMEKEPPQNYDLIVVDAFSSDAIPVHLLTEEAIQLYFRNLKPDGVLAIHVSNRYIELEPVLEQQALRAGKRAATVNSPQDLSRYCFETTWVLLTGREDLLNRPEILKRTRPPLISINLPLWTDDYSNVFQLLR